MERSCDPNFVVKYTMGLFDVGQLFILCLVAIVSTVFTSYYWLAWRSPRTLPSTPIDGRAQTHRTFRVRGVPGEWDRGRVQTFLTVGDSVPAIKSLAREIHGRSKSATVTYQNIPAALCNTPPKTWENPVPTAPEAQSACPESLDLDANFYGMTTLFAPPEEDHKLDVIAISGLGGHAFGSFKQRGGEHMWLRDSLPHHLKDETTHRPMARLITYGYESTVANSRSIQHLEDLATSFQSNLLALASSSQMKPILFIAHSLGGLILKQVIIRLARSNIEEESAILRAVYGIVFFGVPHDGMDTGSLMSMVGEGPNMSLILSIDRVNSWTLSNQQRDFHMALGGQGKTEIVCFYETLQSPTAIQDRTGRWTMTGPLAVLVTKSSATHGRLWEDGEEHICAVARSHSDIVKFTPNDPEYDTAYERLKGLARRAVSANISSGHGFPASHGISMEEYCRDKPEAISCLGDLILTNPSEDRDKLKRKKGDRAPDTCEWITKSEEITAWLDLKNQATNILWLHGNPGTGKSTMAIFLTEKLSETVSSVENNAFAYFFCDSNFDKCKTAISVVRGLLYQIVHQKPQLLNHLLLKYKERKGQLFESFDALWAIFMDIARDPKITTIYCIIDALDECDMESQKLLLRQFEDSFLRSVAPRIRILITSRPYPEIRESLGQFAHKDLSSFTQARQDIDRCIEQRVAELTSRKQYSLQVSQKISKILKDKAEGTFLWIGLACLELEGKRSKDAIKYLQSMPKGLDSLYQSLLNTALEEDGSEPDVLWRILNFVAVSLQPMTVLELSEACRLHQEEDKETQIQYMREDIATCRLMVIIQDDKVLLLHQSVKDFLAKSSTTEFNEQKAHAKLAYCCLDLLMQQFHGAVESNVGFSHYAIQNWPHHAHLAESMFQISDLQAEFFTVESPCREQWLDRLSSGTYIYPEIPKAFSALHVAGRWGIVKIVDYIHELHKHDDRASSIFNCEDSTSTTALEVAVVHGHIAVIQRLLEHAVTVNIRVVIAAVENWQNSAEVMALMLKERGEEVNITEKVLEAAAENWQNGTEVMALLLKERPDEVIITEKVVIAAAENQESGAEVLALLLKERRDQVTITEKVLEAAAENWRNGTEVMVLLLQERPDEVIITEEVVIAAAKNQQSGAEVLTLLLKERRDEVVITEKVIIAAVGNLESGTKVLALLLKERRDQVTITEKVLDAAAGNWRSGTQVMALLLGEAGDQITLTEAAMCSIARSCSKDVMTLLPKERGEEVTITEKVLEAAAGNSQNGAEFMALLLKERPNEVVITERVVIAAVGNYESGIEVLALLLKERQDQVTITEKVLEAAAGNWQNGTEVMALLLQERPDEVVITERVVIAAAGNYKSGTEVMALLLKERANEIIITETVLEAAAENWQNGTEIMALLLQERPDKIVITERVVISAVENLQTSTEVMALLLKNRGDEVVITDKVVIAAAGNWQTGTEVMALLLKERADEIMITEKVVIAAVGNHESGAEVMALLLKERGEEMYKLNVDAKDNKGRTPLSYAAGSGNDAIVKMLLDTKVDPNVRDANGRTPLIYAARREHPQTVELLLSAGAHPNSEDCYGTTALMRAVSKGNKVFTKLMLDNGANLDAGNRTGWSLIQLAAWGGHKEVEELLQSRGASGPEDFFGLEMLFSQWVHD